MSLRGLHGRDVAERIVGGGAPDDAEPEEHEDAEPEAEESDPRIAAARTVLDANRDEDAEGFADALDALCSMHEAAQPAEAKPALKVALGRKVAT